MMVIWDYHDTFFSIVDTSKDVPLSWAPIILPASYLFLHYSPSSNAGNIVMLIFKNTSLPSAEEN